MLSILLTLLLGGAMTVEAKYAGIWFGKPPLKRLDLDVTVKNSSDKPRWLFVPGTVDSPTKTGGVYGVTIYEGGLWSIEGSRGGTAVKLAPQSEATLKSIGVQAWYSDLPPKIVLPLVFADDLTLGGKPIAAFVGADQAAKGAIEAHIDRMKTKVLAWRQTEKEANGLHEEVDLTFVSEEAAPRVVWLLGSFVTLEGKAEEAKEGSLLISGDEQYWIDGAEDWPRGKRVKVHGKVIEKYDRPVFVQKKGEPIKAGIPVPEGTRLKEASHRYLIGEAKWTSVD
jgi:hypothetical protein